MEPAFEITAPPSGCKKAHDTLLTPAAVAFLAQLIQKFDMDVEMMMQERTIKKLKMQMSGCLPDFSNETRDIAEGDWKVDDVPARLSCRHVDLGDVSPSNADHFIQALNSGASGVQVDFDDGHCPTWANQLTGLYNVYQKVYGKLPGAPSIEKAPVLMLRPRAWNMVENHMMVSGKAVPGPLFDFGLLMFHLGKTLLDIGCGPFFYLSKLEGYTEARLWNEIFVWTQDQLRLPRGSIKACVLIENVFAAFEMQEILYELRHHSLGLNCGIWDYSASFINKFGHRPDFVLPDRVKYVSMERHFLKSYMNLVIKTCHQRHCHATGGMSPFVLPKTSDDREIIERACRSKLQEIDSGVDGVLVYDIGLVEPVKKLFNDVNQFHVRKLDLNVAASDLLLVPQGGVTLDGLQHNVAVGILFIYWWLQGRGHFVHNEMVEDSATAEISRSQVWQWIRHEVLLEDGKTKITHSLVKKLITDFCTKNLISIVETCPNEEDLKTACGIFEQIVTKRNFPEFITTYLSEEYAFWKNDK